MREVRQGEYYRHFKDRLYQVLTIARHAETEEKMVVYQSMYNEQEVLVCSYDAFIQEVDHKKYPEAAQTYCFEKVEPPTEANPLLLRFLDLETYRDKLELFQSWETYEDENLMESIAASLDIALSSRTVQEKYREILNCLKTMEHFETHRFR
ncbi:MAG: DUF1653 domain-containing protein [Lachnospiraceae bacterium]|nr:DUF1653 domain-containing protein [Lachnospiraceae bacterium]